MHECILCAIVECRMMYWSDWGSVAVIEKASMDGANRTVLHNTSLKFPNALTLDISTQTLYWADARLDTVEKSNVDGTSRQLVIQGGISHPFHMIIWRDELLISDWGSFIVRVNLTSEETLPLSDKGFCNLPNEFRIVSQHIQPASKFLKTSFMMIRLLEVHGGISC